MMNASLPNLMHGIQLVQAGRLPDALPYLRLAARTEAIPADGWLWLAAATDDREEYRHCVNQALHLAPGHPVAQRMLGELNRQEPWAWSGGTSGTGYPPVRVATGQMARGRRILRALAVLVIAAACVGAVAALALSTSVSDTVRGWLESTNARALEFSVGTLPTYRFRVQVPDTWLPANEDDPAWREARADLEAAFPPPDGLVSAWAQVGASFSAAVRDPVYGEIVPPLRVVETDPDALERDGLVTALTLEEIVPLPALEDDTPATVCDRMRLLEEQARSGEALAPRPGEETLESRVVERGGADGCAVLIQRRATGLTPQQVPFALAPDRAPDAVRSVVFAVPTSEARYAVWRLTLAESATGHYDRTIETIADTLRRVAES
jgi:hypothetical protein